MALTKPIDVHDTGLPLSYWAITQAKLDHLAKRVEVTLHGWRDAPAKLAGRSPGAPLILHLRVTDLRVNDLHAVTTATLYDAIKRRANAGSTELERQPAGIAEALAAGAHGLLADAGDC